MATKTISVTDEVYNLLKKLKLKNENFGDTIKRLCREKNLSQSISLIDDIPLGSDLKNEEPKIITLNITSPNPRRDSPNSQKCPLCGKIKSYRYEICLKCQRKLYPMAKEDLPTTRLEQSICPRCEKLKSYRLHICLKCQRNLM